MDYFQLFFLDNNDNKIWDSLNLVLFLPVMEKNCDFDILEKPLYIFWKIVSLKEWLS